MTNQHLAVVASSLAASLTNTKVNAVQDPILTILNNDYVVPQSCDLLAAAIFGTSIDRGRINTPKFREIGLPSIVPVNVAAAVTGLINMMDSREHPMRLAPVDEIAIEASTDASGTAIVYGALWLGFGRQNVAPGPTYRLRFTAAITAVANAWTFGTIAMDQTLPAGRYAVVGLDVVATNCLFARLIFPGDTYRPGVVARNAVGVLKHPIFEVGQMGVLGEFNSINLPQLEILASGACTVQTGYIDVQLLSRTSGL